MESIKRKWGKPGLDVQVFMPNESVAACWIVHCNVGKGYGWVDSNNNDKPDTDEYCVSPTAQQSKPSNGYYGTYVSNSTEWNYVSGCGVEHKGVSIGQSGPTANAKWQEIWGRGWPFGWPYDVYAWVDENGDGHATKISSAEWQTNPNAS